MSHPPKPLVFLVGAGPGDPGLLTLRGKECLERADLVLYDQLVSPRLLDYVPPHAEKVCVRELASCHPDRWPHIHRLLVEAASTGKCVVRLKGGDPLIFGRGGEEAEALRAAGIPYEIVPGVTAALAAGAYLEIPLTHRAHASAVAFVTGHENPTKESTHLDWPALARFPGTLAIYMGLARLGLIVRELVRHGKDPQTPAVVVYKASTGEQLSVSAPLIGLDDAVRAAGLTTPALALIGSVVGLKPERAWSEARPLLGKRVLVTRPRQQAGPLVHQLELLGAVGFVLPTVEVRDPADWGPVDDALDRLRGGGFDWLVFTSANGVHALIRRLKQRGRDLRDLGAVKLAAVGGATAAALREYHLEPDVVPAEELRAETLAAMLQERTAGGRVLLALADRGRELLREQLSARASVEQVAVYAQADAVEPDPEILDHLRRGEIDFVTLTSANGARAFLGVCDETVRGRLKQGEIAFVTNSPRTSAAVRAEGFPVAKESANPTAEALVRALIDLADEGGRSESDHRPA